MEIVNKPTIQFIDEHKRTDGISAMMRIRNGEDFLKISILSIIDQVDEIICVFNNSSDKTEEILLSLEKQYPEKIKIYKYIPVVYPPNSQGHINTPEQSVQSLAYYYNFALSKTSKKYVFKFDDDHLKFKNILPSLKVEIENEPDKSIGLRGINLFDYKENLFINKNTYYTSGKDTLLFKYNKTCVFKKSHNYEVFQSNHKLKRIVDCFYHLKQCKKDRGINNYDLNENENSRYLQINKNHFENLDLIDFEKTNHSVQSHPFTLGFQYVNNSEKNYNYDLFNKLENNIKQNVKKNIFIFGNAPQEKKINNFLFNLKNKHVVRINDFGEKFNGTIDELYFDTLSIFLGELGVKFIENNSKFFKGKNVLVLRHNDGSIRSANNYKLYPKILKLEKEIGFNLNFISKNFFHNQQKLMGITPDSGTWSSSGFLTLNYFIEENENIYIHGFSKTKKDWKLDPLYTKYNPDKHNFDREYSMIEKMVSEKTIKRI